MLFLRMYMLDIFFFFFQAEDGIRDGRVTGVQTCALPISTVNIVWENRQFGSIVWKQDRKFGRHFGVDFTNPDFVALGESFGLPSWRCESIDDFSEYLDRALG